MERYAVGAVKQTEALACTTVITAHLDRPLGADGSRLGPTLPGSLLVFETPTASGVVLTGQAPQALPLPEPIAIALTNALVITMPAQSLLLVAGFTASATELISGSLLLGFGFLRLLPTLPDLGAAVRTGDTADGTSQRNVLLDRRPAPGGGQLSGSGATLAGPGAATWDRVMIQDLLAVLALPPNAPLSVLAAELLPELSPPADPLSGSLGQVRILRTSPLTPVPAIC